MENLVPGLPRHQLRAPRPSFFKLNSQLLSEYCFQYSDHLFLNHILLGSKLLPNMATVGTHSLAIGFQFADLEVDQQVILAMAGTWGRPCHGAELSGRH